jgi:hypothetical protein
MEPATRRVYPLKGKEILFFVPMKVEELLRIRYNSVQKFVHILGK